VQQADLFLSTKQSPARQRRRLQACCMRPAPAGRAILLARRARVARTRRPSRRCLGVLTQAVSDDGGRTISRTVVRSAREGRRGARRYTSKRGLHVDAPPQVGLIVGKAVGGDLILRNSVARRLRRPISARISGLPPPRAAWSSGRCRTPPGRRRPGLAPTRTPRHNRLLRDERDESGTTNG